VEPLACQGVSSFPRLFESGRESENPTKTPQLRANVCSARTAAGASRPRQWHRWTGLRAGRDGP